MLSLEVYHLLRLTHLRSCLLSYVQLSLTDHLCVFPLIEFQPGVPWKGIDRVDPESDPYMTPGSMMGNAVSPNLNDTEHQLLQDNTGRNEITAATAHLYTTFIHVFFYNISKATPGNIFFLLKVYNWKR